MIHVVLLAAGRSERYGKPKLLEKLGSISVLEMSLRNLQNCSVIDDVVIVSSDVVMEHAVGLFKRYSKVSKIVKGGKTRRESSKIGVESLMDDDIVLIHDAARPFASCSLFGKVVEKVKICGAAIPVVELRDTVAVVEGREILEIPNRKRLKAIQTPQGFFVGLIKKAHEIADLEVTDDSKLVLRMGKKVCFVEGEVRNFKITFPIDLLIARAFLENPEEFDR